MALIRKYPVASGIALIILGLVVSAAYLWWFPTDMTAQMIGLPFMVPGILLIMVSRLHRARL